MSRRPRVLSLFWRNGKTHIALEFEAAIQAAIDLRLPVVKDVIVGPLGLQYHGRSVADIINRRANQLKNPPTRGAPPVKKEWLDALHCNPCLLCDQYCGLEAYSAQEFCWIWHIPLEKTGKLRPGFVCADCYHRGFFSDNSIMALVQKLILQEEVR